MEKLLPGVCFSCLATGAKTAMICVLHHGLLVALVEKGPECWLSMTEIIKHVHSTHLRQGNEEKKPTLRLLSQFTIKPLSPQLSLPSGTVCAF